MHTSMWDRRRFLSLAAWAAAQGSLPRSAWGAAALRHEAFTLGVASGDPNPSGVVLWTRLLGGEDPLPAVPLPVRWEIAEDAAFRRIVQRGSSLALPALGYSVHVEVGNLPSGRWFHYRFLQGASSSTVGRTRTAPAPDSMPERLRLAFASCQRWEHGFYAAWADVARQRPDLVLFLGDYLYEYATPKDTEGLARTHTLRHARNLADYRDRYALHKSDVQLQAAHAACPWSVVWDDHEVQNDYAGEVGRDDRADFPAQRSAAYRAFYENMPLRSRQLQGHGFQGLQLYRRLQWGRLTQLHLLDGRQYRDRQACRRTGASGAGAVKPSECEALQLANRSFLGTPQERWLDAGLAQDAAQDLRWSTVAQTTLFSPRHYPSGIQATDTWDGYPAARERLVSSLARHVPSSAVLLGGDIHQNYVCRVPRNSQNLNGPAVATEFCGTSISSRSGTTQEKLDAIVRHNPHIALARCGERGYGLAEITPQQWTTQLRVVDDPLSANSAVRTLASFVVEQGRPGSTATSAPKDKPNMHPTLGAFRRNTPE